MFYLLTYLLTYRSGLMGRNEMDRRTDALFKYAPYREGLRKHDVRNYCDRPIDNQIAILTVSDRLRVCRSCLYIHDIRQRLPHKHAP